MADSTRSNDSLERHTGADALIKFKANGSYKEIPVTNVSWNRDFSTNDLQHSGSLKPTLTTTGVRFEGSFEYDGQNPDALELVAQNTEDSNVSPERPTRGTLTIKERDHDNDGNNIMTVTFTDVLVMSNNRELPADGSSSTSYDWEAEDMTVKNQTE